MATIFLFALVVDLVVVPWPYALRNYFLKGSVDQPES